MTLKDSFCRFTALLLAAITLYGASGCDGDPLPEVSFGSGPGSLVAVQELESLSLDRVRAFELPVAASFPVNIDRIEYRTSDASGREIVVSGAVVYPVGTTGPVPLVSYQHGTVVLRDDVASVQGSSGLETLVAIAFAGSGYAVVMPDYPGLGVSTSLHPYVHAASLAASVADGIAAAGRVLDARLALSGELLLVGYSEGGYATAAAQRRIEAIPVAGFSLVASAPLAAPFDLSGTMVEIFTSGLPYEAVWFLPYAVLAYDAIYDLFDDPAEVFASPYDTTIPALFDGQTRAADIEAALPSVPADLINPGYLAEFQSRPDHPLRVRLEENDLLDWTPLVPTRLYHCTADELVPYGNAVTAFETFSGAGAPDLRLEPLDFGGHGACAGPALLLARAWFDEVVADR